MLHSKGIGRLEVKDAEQGIVSAVVSTLNAVDRDKDVILPGAIPDGTRVKLSGYGHGVILYDEPPVGKGTLTVKGNDVVFDGQYFMDTDAGRDAFAVVRGLAEDGEWSIGFLNVKTSALTAEWKNQGARRVIESIEVVEVSPVFMGANQYTETIVAKRAGSGEVSEVMRLAALAAKGIVAEQVAAAEAKANAFVDRLSMTPDAVTGNVATTAQLTATPYDSENAAIDGKVITWSSDNAVVATVDGSGLVRFAQEGTCTITATCETKTATATAAAQPDVASQQAAMQAAATQKQRAITDELERFQRTRRRIGFA